MQHINFYTEKVGQLISAIKSEQSTIHRLGDITDSKKPIQQPMSNPYPYSESFVMKFQQTNPFYHVHKALQEQCSQKEPRQKYFQDVLNELLQMNQMCQKLLSSEIEEQVSCQKTLILDLQNLQSHSVNLKPPHEQREIQSNVSIKCHIDPEVALCDDEECDKINQVLSKAVLRIQQLTEVFQQLQRNLQKEKSLKEKQEKQNQQLRSQISKLDEKKCRQIEMLKKEIHELKINSSDFSLAQQIGRVPVESNCKQDQQKVPMRKSLQRIRQDLAQQIERPSSVFKMQSVKLRNKVYL